MNKKKKKKIDDCFQLPDLGFEEAIRWRIRDHHAGQIVLVARGQLDEIFHVNVARFRRVHLVYLHAGHRRTSRICAVSRRRNETHFATLLTYWGQIAHYGSQARIFALGATVRLQRNLIVAGYFAQIATQLVKHAMIAFHLIAWHKRMNGIELGPRAWLYLIIFYLRN